MPPSARPLRSPILWGVAALYVSLAALYALVTPPFEKPDESWHFAFAMHVAGTGALPVQRLEGRNHLAEQEGSQPPLYYALFAAMIRAAALRDLEPGYRALTQENPFYGGRPGAWHSNANQYLHGPCEGDCGLTARVVGLGRTLSIAFGVVALFAASWALALAFPGERWLHLAVLGALAFNPQFLHISSAVSNDAATVAMVNLALALTLWWQRRPSASRAAAIGLVAGLATLAKASGLSVGLVAGLWLLMAPGLALSRRAATLAAFGATFLTATGWWFARNLALYGEATATAIHLRVYGTPPAPASAARLLAEWRAIANSYWASFGWGGLNLSDPIYDAVRWLALGLAALSLALVIRRWRALAPPARLLLALSAAQLLVVVALLARWNRLTVAPLGRLLFPAALPIALLLTVGALWALPARWRSRVAVGYSAGLATVALLLGIFLVQPAYAPPEPLAALPSAATSLDVTFGEAIRLEGVELPESDVAPGAVVPITLYWRALAPIDEPLAVGLVLHGRDGAALAKADSFPAEGRFPTTAWRPGELVRDEWRLLVEPDAAPTLAPLEIALFRPEDGSFLPATSGGETLGTVRPASLLVRAPVAPTASATSFRVVEPQLRVREREAELSFVWEVGQPLEGGPYQMLVHLTAGEGEPPIAVGDRAPQSDRYPTTLWQPGERLPESMVLPVPSDASPGAYDLLVGLYDPVTLQPLRGEGGRSVWSVGRLRWDGATWRAEGGQ